MAGRHNYPQVRVEKGNASYGSRTVEKALEVLLELSRHPEGMNNLTVSKTLQLDKSTSHRLLTTLERKRMLRRDPLSRRFFVGYGLLQVALGPHTDLRLIARPMMQYLVNLTQETVSLSVR